MNPQEYEELISQLTGTIFELANGNPGMMISSGRKNRLFGISGYSHQIDVSVRNENHLLLVECKYWKKKIPVEKVLAFYGRVADIQPMFKGQSHGIMATTRGFQPGAETLAKHYRLDLCWVQSVHEFGMKYKDYFIIGVCDSVKVGEWVSVKISD